MKILTDEDYYKLLDDILAEISSCRRCLSCVRRAESAMILLRHAQQYLGPKPEGQQVRP